MHDKHAGAPSVNELQIGIIQSVVSDSSVIDSLAGCRANNILKSAVVRPPSPWRQVVLLGDQQS
jgi:hypothetical protein